MVGTERRVSEVVRQRVPVHRTGDGRACCDDVVVRRDGGGWKIEVADFDMIWAKSDGNLWTVFKVTAKNIWHSFVWTLCNTGQSGTQTRSDGWECTALTVSEIKSNMQRKEMDMRHYETCRPGCPLCLIRVQLLDWAINMIDLRYGTVWYSRV